MSKIKHTVAFTMMAILMAVGCQASVLDSLHIDARLGYVLGGTLPTRLDNKIRHINNYGLGLNFVVSVEGELPLSSRWGLHSGLRFEIQGMDVDSRVKNYDIEVVRGDESLDGIFNGNVRIRSAQRRITLPIQASYHCSPQLELRGGIFMGWLVNRRFWGWAYDGYLREGTPVGPKIEMGREPGERGDFDFDKDMRHMQWGVDAGLDWHFHLRWSLFAELTYSLSGLFKSGFTSVQTLRPMYGSLGVSYRIK